MAKAIKTIQVQNTSISIASFNEDDFICITDMAKAKDGDARAADIIKNWIRNRATLEFLGTWEQLHNDNFKVVEFDHFRMQAGLPSFTLSTGQWVEKTNATEADVLNMALFRKTAKQWRDENPNSEGNIRDYDKVEQLLVLANIESMNAEFIRMKLPQGERLKKLNEIARAKLKSLANNPNTKRLDDGKE